MKYYIFNCLRTDFDEISLKTIIDNYLVGKSIEESEIGNTILKHICKDNEYFDPEESFSIDVYKAGTDDMLFSICEQNFSISFEKLVSNKILLNDKNVDFGIFTKKILVSNSNKSLYRERVLFDFTIMSESEYTDLLI